MTIEKVLIANRGEIAVRVIRTLRKDGVASVALFHELDRNSPYVLMADEAVELTGQSPVASYLDIAQVITACKNTGANAVHPGFGFLSENAEFARKLEAEGIIFIGPTPEAIAAMGDKVVSKKIASEAGVSTVPGLIDCVADAQRAVEVAADIGYPVMLKASAGGGGKGMRIATNEEECREFFERTTREAKSGFGDGRIFVEKFVSPARHIEIQVLADAHGNVVHLGERECSIQRRHQKVIEEAPSPFIDEKTRMQMGAQAVSLAKSVGYRSAGTVEFIVDGEQNFYFLEMNTRLQVEHPVTEMVTGIDIVREQLRIASGEPLGYGQEQIDFRGHAVECRIYAENADEGFTPATGELLVYREPSGEGIRIDSGITNGSEISSAFDPMLAKLIAYGSDRAEAISKARVALKEFVLLGVTTNTAYLERVLAHECFKAGDFHTGFLEEKVEALTKKAPSCVELAIVVAAAALSDPGFTDSRYVTAPHLAAIGEWSN